MPNYYTLDQHKLTSTSLLSGTYEVARIPLTSLPPSFISRINEATKISKPNSHNWSPTSTYYGAIQTSDYYPKIHKVNYLVKNTSSFMKFLQNNYSLNINSLNLNELYPIAVRYTNNKNLWVIERPPFQATITYRQTRSSSKSEKYLTFDIYMPWTIMVLDIDYHSSFYSAWVYFNDSPLQSLDDEIIPCFFPNTYTDGRLCLNQTTIGLQRYLADTNQFTISNVYNYLLNDYMSGGWNLDLGIQTFDYITSNVTTDFSLLYKTKEAVRYGDNSLNIKSSITPTGRINYSKMITNLLKYFSTLSLDQSLQFVSEAKQSSQKIKRVTTLNKVLENITSSSRSHSDFSSFFNDFFSNVSQSSIYYSAYLISHPDSLISNDHYGNTADYKDDMVALMASLSSFLTSHHSDKIKAAIDDPSYYNVHLLNTKDYILLNPDNTFSLYDSSQEEFPSSFPILSGAINV